MNDTIINKIQSIERCIERAREIYTKNEKDFLIDFDAQDAAVLNVIRACDLAIDLANHLIKLYKMGIPTSSSESFELLMQKHVIPLDLAESLTRMISFRNITVHEYKKINYDIVVRVITEKLNDLILFIEFVMDYVDANPS
jgi:uncharacterized protein YutE (UPF0331/DUF86 family)